jgi:hypothetical protein
LHACSGCCKVLIENYKNAINYTLKLAPHNPLSFKDIQDKKMINKPPYRKLKGYAFDPSLSLQMQTATINQIIYKIPWEDLQETTEEKAKREKDKNYESQGIGPIGEYLEVLDYDPTVNQFYKAVDLNDSYLLAQDGLEPSEGNPQFHQQMVYAVAMTTIKNFEAALGRKIIWAPRRIKGPKYEEYVQRLRIYPHALREANAYYSPAKKALLFGYFSASPTDENLHMPNSLVFTCLSHDIIAHETTHAIIDGLHRNYNDATNPDVLAFHEAFADIVALFQHFTFPEVLKNQIAETRGDLNSQNLLGQLAQQFGSAIGHYGSLRDAIGEVDKKTKIWRPKEPRPQDYREIIEPHTRGSILVAAIFEAFLSIYKNKVADLLRIATGGSGILQSGALHPDLINRLADEAAKSASHVLKMCIRALDYCPPVDITFGEFLRAIITADVDLVNEDTRHYRLAFIEAFRRRGIYAKGIKTLSVESLQHVKEPTVSKEAAAFFNGIADFLRDYRAAVFYTEDREEIFQKTREYIAGKYHLKESTINGLHIRLVISENPAEMEKLTGLIFSKDYTKYGVRPSSIKNDSNGEPIGPSIQIQSLRHLSRLGPKGEKIDQIVLTLIQRCGVHINEGVCSGCYVPDSDSSQTPETGFEFRGGCTLIFDLNSLKLRYIISKPLIDIDNWDKNPCIDMERAEAQYAFQNDYNYLAINEFAQYFGKGLAGNSEPFALLHQDS